MRLQNLIIIFIVIALPVILILSVYVQYQVDAAYLRASYDSVFLGATYDMLSAFQLNTTNNKYSTVSDALIRDIEASINTFTNSFGTGLGLTGTSKNDVFSYVPALVFTLYDGYYIYTPTISEVNPGEFVYEHQLKPYVYYTKEYSNGNKKLIINFSIDNYVAVYYDNDASTPETYQSRAGYLEVLGNSSGVTGEIGAGPLLTIRDERVNNNGDSTIIREYIEIPYTDEILNRLTFAHIDSNSNEKYEEGEFVKVPDTKNDKSKSAYNYYLSAYNFTNWYNGIINEFFDNGSVMSKEYKRLYINGDNNPNPIAGGSGFLDEKTEVIEESIKGNLIQAMETYKTKSGVLEFQMPEFSATEWEKILNNVCVISFVQGFPVGTSTYNNYVILSSTENKQTVNDADIYYIAYDKDGKTDGYYHRLGCPHLGDINNDGKIAKTDNLDHITGYNRTDFIIQTAIGKNGTILKQSRDGGIEYDHNMYYYKHDEKACYYCVVNAIDPSINNIPTGLSPEARKMRLSAYYMAIAREKYDLLKASEYVNGSKKIYEIE